NTSVGSGAHELLERSAELEFIAFDQLDQLPAGERAADRAGVRGHPTAKGSRRGKAPEPFALTASARFPASGALQPLTARPRPGCGSPRRGLASLRRWGRGVSAAAEHEE